MTDLIDVALLKVDYYDVMWTTPTYGRSAAKKRDSENNVTSETKTDLKIGISVVDLVQIGINFKKLEYKNLFHKLSRIVPGDSHGWVASCPGLSCELQNFKRLSHIQYPSDLGSVFFNHH